MDGRFLRDAAMRRDMKMEKEYNLLTKRLLAEGYTAEGHPDYVKVCSSAWGKELWQNLAGGFEYTSNYLQEMVFKTGCGLLVKGSRLGLGRMSYMGIEWMPENDNPVIGCPYRKDSCSLKNTVLRDASQCDCHQTDEPYNYEQSIEKVRDDEEREKQKRYDAFAERVNGHVCHWHMGYDYYTGEWKQHYDPIVCARDCKNVGGICSLTHKPVSRKRGNVFYDIKISCIRHDGTLFDGEKIVRIEKGVRLFKTAKSMTICESAEKRCREYICSKVKDRYYSEIRLCGWEVEILNIRAEQRESRDLIQDLQDIKEGIMITHASDVQKRQKEEKKRRKQQAREKRIKRLEEKILQVGYGNLGEHSLDRVHADKWLGEEKIQELEEMRQKKLEEGRNQPKQMSLFDFPGVVP